MKVGLDDLIAQGADAAAVEGLPRVVFTPTIAPEALHGVAGRLVEAIESYSEADPVAILTHVLAGIGNLVGRGPYAQVEKTVHTCAEFMALVGETAKGRKGQAWSTPRHVFCHVDEAWVVKRVRTGLSSGEGLIYHVRDPQEETIPVKEKGRVVDYQRVTTDPGEDDKRLFVSEPEFASALRRMAGETNSLSAVLRQAWDDGALSTLTRNSPLRATGAHVSIVAHVTREELVGSLSETEKANGFANRFLFFLVRRSKFLPDGAEVPDESLQPLVEELRRVVEWARVPRRMVRDEVAAEVWRAIYPKLSEGEPGLLGAILARAEAHVLRLSLLYAVLDLSLFIQLPHLKAALAVWEYAAASARRIFGDRLGLSVADVILEALRARGPMTRTDIAGVFHRNKPASEIDAALRVLEEKGRARKVSRPPEGGRGRYVEEWSAA